MSLLKKKCRKKKSGGFMALLDRLMMLSVIIPPGYIIYRFIRWYSQQEEGDGEES